MDRKQNIEQQVEHALTSLDNCRRASASPYLMTRINAALGAGKLATTWDKLYAVITRPVIAFAGIVIILIVNILIITSYRNEDTIKFQADTNSDWQSYSTATNRALYDIENNIEP